MIDLKVPTLDLVRNLEKVAPDKLLEEEPYLWLKELTLRQLYRQNWQLSKKDINDLAHIITVNILLFLTDAIPRGFKMTNWLKYVYNKSAKTAAALFVHGGSERNQVIRFEDYLEEQDFIRRYFYNQLSVYSDMDEFECNEGIRKIGELIPTLAKKLIRYSNNYSNFRNILYSAIFSFLQDRPIFLTPTTAGEQQYIINLWKLLKIHFPDYMKKNLIDGSSLLNDYLNNMQELMIYERIENEK